MSNLIETSDGIARDENGQIHIRPFKALGEMMAAAGFSVTKKDDKDNSKRSTIRRNLALLPPLAPLHINLSEFEDIEQKSKRPKLEKTISKELFKMPQKKTVQRLSGSNNRKAVGRNSSLGRISLTNSKKRNIPVKKQVAVSDGSPLFDVEDAEKLLLQKQSFIKPIVKTVLFPPLASIKEESNSTQVTNETRQLLNEISLEKNSPPDRNKRQGSTSSSVDSEREFLELEKQLASVKKSAKNKNILSPITSVCSLLEKTKIATPTTKGQTEKLSHVDVLNFLKETRNEMRVIEEILQKRGNGLDRIIEYLEQLKEKENLNIRRQSPQTSKSVQMNTVSPVTLKKEDLRKATLNKNLSKILRADSPRTKDAVNMYNRIRSDCSILCTPKMDRSNIDLQQGSVTRSLSRRIQKQCLLLQDTPRPGKTGL